MTGMTNEEIANAVIEDLVSRGLSHENGPSFSHPYDGHWIEFIVPGDCRIVSVLIQNG
jgi:hypothetical protein